MRLKSIAIQGCLAFLALSTLVGIFANASESQLPQASDTSSGWIIFQSPKTGENNEKVRGQARKIFSAWLCQESSANTVVYVTYPDSQVVPIHFLFASRAQALMTAIEEGKSVDVSSCAHSKFVSSTAPDESGCFENTYRTEFHCDLLSVTDRPKLVDSSTVNTDEFDTNGTAEPEIASTQSECAPVMVD